MTDAMMATFFKTKSDGLRSCSFFDPNVPNGGPRPNNDADNDNVGRKRRDVDAEDPFDVYEQNLQNGERSASVRLSNDPAVAHRENGNHSQRLKRITDQTLGMMTSIKAYYDLNP